MSAPRGQDGLTAKEREQLTMQASAFDALERDFREILEELVGDKSLERFRIEYEKLRNTLQKSHENEKRLIKKCRELNKEIVNNAAKISAALRLSAQDQQSITLLKREIDKAWKMVDGAQEKERRARETITRLRGEIQNLSRLVEHGIGLSQGQKDTVSKLWHVKEELSRTVTQQEAEIGKLNSRIKELDGELEGMRENKTQMEVTARNQRERISKMKVDAAQQKRTIKTVQDRMKVIQDYSDNYQKQIAALQRDLKASKERNETQQSTIGRLKLNNDHYHKTVEDLTRCNELLERDIGQAKGHVKQLRDQVDDAMKVVKRHEDSLLQHKQMVNLERKRVSRLEKDMKDLANERDGALNFVTQCKADMRAMETSIDAQNRDAEIDEKLIKELQAQIKRLAQAMRVSQEKNRAAKEHMEDQEDVNAHLEEDIRLHKLEGQQLRERNYQLENEREQAALREKGLFNRVKELKAQIRVKDLLLEEVKRRIQEERAKLKQQQQMYEQVRSDRNVFSKQQTQAEDTIAEMRKKFQLMLHEIQQLKEEIQAKDRILVQEHLAYKQLKDELKVKKRQLDNRKERLIESDQVLRAQDQEVKSLRRTLKEIEIAQTQQKHIYEEVVQERDVLGTQLVRRNDEIALLYEKIRILQATTTRGEVQYQHRLEDLQNVKLALQDLKRQLQIKNQAVSHKEALKNEVYHAQRELLQERMKVKALSEELENPMNVHRWRTLEGSDPARFELIQKVQTLQKRLILQTESMVEKQLVLEKKDQLYEELKGLLRRQPGPEVAEQLSVYQHSLRGKKRKMKEMASELNMLHAQNREYDFEVKKLTRELQDTKRKYYEQKKMVRQLEKSVGLAGTMPLPRTQASGGKGYEGVVGGSMRLSGVRQPVTNAFTGGDGGEMKVAERQNRLFQAAVPSIRGGGFHGVKK